MPKPDFKAGKRAIEELLAAPLFSHIGENLTLGPDRKNYYRPVKNWQDAAFAVKDDDRWLFVGTEAMNDRCLRVRDSFGQDWFNKNINQSVDKVNGFLPSALKPLLSKEVFKEIGPAKKEVMRKLTYDLRNIALEHVYAELLPLSYFRQVIAPVYAAGHFPCGWKGRFVRGVEKNIDNGGVYVY